MCPLSPSQTTILSLFEVVWNDWMTIIFSYQNINFWFAFFWGKSNIANYKRLQCAISQQHGSAKLRIKFMRTNTISCHTRYLFPSVYLHVCVCVCVHDIVRCGSPHFWMLNDYPVRWGVTSILEFRELKPSMTCVTFTSQRTSTCLSLIKKSNHIVRISYNYWRVWNTQFCHSHSVLLFKYRQWRTRVTVLVTTCSESQLSPLG